MIKISLSFILTSGVCTNRTGRRCSASIEPSVDKDINLMTYFYLFFLFVLLSQLPLINSQEAKWTTTPMECTPDSLSLHLHLHLPPTHSTYTHSLAHSLQADFHISPKRSFSSSLLESRGKVEGSSSTSSFRLDRSFFSPSWPKPCNELMGCR